jgi:hypothetical protein
MPRANLLLKEIDPSQAIRKTLAPGARTEVVVHSAIEVAIKYQAIPEISDPAGRTIPAASSGERDREPNRAGPEILEPAEKKIHAINLAASDPAQNPALREIQVPVRAVSATIIGVAAVTGNPAAVSRPKILVEA